MLLSYTVEKSVETLYINIAFEREMTGGISTTIIAYTVEPGLLSRIHKLGDRIPKLNLESQDNVLQFVSDFRPAW